LKFKKVFILLSILFTILLPSCKKETFKEEDLPKREDLTFSDETFIYDENRHSLEIEGDVPSGCYVIYKNNNQVNPGEYKVFALVYKKSDEKILYVYKAILRIITKESLKLESKTVTYDGLAHSLDLSNCADDFIIESENNLQTEVGKYYIKVDVYTLSHKFLLTIYGILEIESPKNELFEAFTDDFFKLLFEGDQMSINFMFNNPSDYGISHSDAKLSKYERLSDYEASMKEVDDLLDELHQFDVSMLSKEEKKTYEVIERYLDYIRSYKENMQYMVNNYLGSYLGYQANLPLELSEYKFRSEQDVIDFIDFLNSSIDAFTSYIDFARDQVEFGYAMPDFVIDNVCMQCEKFVNMGDDNFLIEIFNEKLDAISFSLPIEKISSYKALAKDAITNTLTNAYRLVLDNLPSLKGKSNVYGGLAMYGEDGKTLYKNMLGNILGIKDIDVDKIYGLVYNKLMEARHYLYFITIDAKSLSSAEYMKFYNAITNGEPDYSDKSFGELPSYFKELFKSIVPEITDLPSISIKMVPDALKDNFSPAAYFISALDETNFESIYLNPNYEDDYNYIFTTLAHEGYPGHLYQNVYTKSLDINKVRKVLKTSGYTEGWATYVENIAYTFVSNYESPGLRLALEYNRLSRIYSLTLNAMLDMKIHYYNENLDEITNFIISLTNGNYNASMLKAAYEQLIEIPTNMSMYATSFVILDKLREDAIDTLGDDFNELEFNTILLKDGAAPLDIVRNNVEEYINDILYIKYGTVN